MRKFTYAAVGLLASAGIALAGGAFNGFPIVGDPGNDVCLSFGNNGVCNQFSPAGPSSVTGEENIPADTGLPSGQQPQTVLIPLSLAGGFNNRINRVIGGDFTTNLWQRGTTPLSAGTTSSATMTADRWYAYSSGNTVTVSKQTGAADTLPANGFYASMRVSRPSGTNTSQICVGQVLDKNAAAELIGNNAVLSFYSLAGAGLSAVASNQVQVSIAYYTAADSATPGTNTGTFASGTITGYQAAVGGSSGGYPVATVASGVATVPISTTWTRYGVWGKIPTTNSSGTAITGVGISICYTPTSGTGGSTEWFELIGVQLQAMSSNASLFQPNGITVPTGFSRVSAQQDADLQLYYSQVLIDGAATVRYALGQVTTTTNANIYIPFSDPMREAPSTTVGTATSFGVTIAAGTAAACSTLAAVASSNTTNGATLACTTSGVVAGNATQFIGQATGALVTFSAEP